VIFFGISEAVILVGQAPRISGLFFSLSADFAKASALD
jgi:hypothetical protein